MPDSSDFTKLAQAAVALRLEDVSEVVLAHAQRVIADTIGVSLGGGRRPEIESLVCGDGMLFPPPGGGPSHLLTLHLPRTDPTTAAFVNATAGTFLELDEGYRPTGHPAMHVVPAALAAAEALHTSGREFVAAVLSGYEVAARLFEAYRFTFPLHPHGHVGAVGAAVAVARLRGSNAVEEAAIASTLPLLPIWQACLEGATARNAYMGIGAAIGLVANRMALAGFIGSRESQQVAFGSLVGELTRPEVLTEPIDPSRLRITRNYLKLHSACALSHSALDAVLAIIPRSPDDVVKVEIETISNNMKIACQARPNDLSTRFSIPYAVAAAIVHGHAGPDALVPDSRVARLAERVEVRPAEDLDALWPDAAPARVTIYLRDGVSKSRVDNPRGHHANPASAEDLRAKFVSLVNRPEADDLYERLLHVDEINDMAALFAEVR